MVSDKLKQVSIVLRQREIERPHHIQDLLAFDTYEVVVRYGIGLESFLLGIEREFYEKAPILKDAQGVIDSGKRHGGELP
jgi:hypothetical protein